MDLLEEHMESVDAYIPRRCCATNRIIAAKDHGSIQLNLAVLDAEGVYSGEVDDVVTYALAGYTRLQGESDGWLTLLAAKDNMIKASAFDLPQ